MSTRSSFPSLNNALNNVYISPQEALQSVLHHAFHLGTESINIRQAIGRVSGCLITSPMDIPRFANSAMDGYALRSNDVFHACMTSPIPLVIEQQEVWAGVVFKGEVEQGRCVKIMTGGEIPDGLDCVVPWEDVDVIKDRIYFSAPVPSGKNVRYPGEDIRAGDAVLEQGDVIDEYDIGLLSSLGMDEVEVSVLPRVSVIITGSEVVGAGKKLEVGKIWDSNGSMLYALLSNMGLSKVKLSYVSDDYDETLSEISGSLSSSELVITTGGVSVGEKDLVKDAIAEAGCSMVFWKLRQKPGMPFGMWEKDGKVIFGLPGNPVAVALCFELYIRPFLLKLMGAKEIFRPPVLLRFKSDFENKGERYLMLRVKLVNEPGGPFAVPLSNQGSGVLTSMSRADAVVVVNPGGKIASGEERRGYLMGEIKRSACFEF